MLCSPKRLVLLASALSSLASCRSLCRPHTQSPDTSTPGTNVPPIPPSTTYPSMGSSDNNVSTSNNNSMIMPDTPPTTTPDLTSPTDNLPTPSGNDSSISGSNATGCTLPLFLFKLRVLIEMQQLQRGLHPSSRQPIRRRLLSTTRKVIFVPILLSCLNF